MPSLKADFDELIGRVMAGREFAHASFEPIFYLVFHPSELLEVKRLMPAWTSKLANAGWQVETFSADERLIGQCSVHAGRTPAVAVGGVLGWP